MHDLRGTLAWAAIALDPALAGAAARARVREAAAHLPAALTDRFYLECSLSRADRLDLILRIDPRRAALLAHHTVGDEGWRPLRALAQRWSPQVATLWLELDLPPGAPVLPAPRVFLDFAPGHLDGRSLAPFEALLGAPAPGPLKRALARCRRLLPAHATIPSMGVARLDRWQGLRLCVAGLSGPALAALLPALGWAGDPAVLPAHPGLVHLDLEPDLGPRVGVEVAPHDDLPDADRRRGLRRWSGHTICHLPHELWPSLVARKVSHFKLVHDQRGGSETKAYLCLSHAFHRGAGALPGSAAFRLYR